jgi:hypothetical protein
MLDRCPHCGGELPAVPIPPVVVSHLGADGQQLTLEEVALRARAMASLLEERSGWRLSRRGL